MKTSLFNFELPAERIATTPIIPRDGAKMLVIGEELQDKNIGDLLCFLRVGDVMVFNNTKVIPARLLGMRDSVKIEVLLHKKKSVGLWQCFIKPAKRLKINDIIAFAEDFCAEVFQKHDDGQVLLKFSYPDEVFWDKLEQHGLMPLPPYIERVRHADQNDNQNYQTVYAKHAGSVAAPTAGLHFTEELLEKIDEIGVKRVEVTLHVGGGTFLPVKVENTKDHIMHSEYVTINQDVADAVNEAKKSGGRVIAVGTTSVRSLESASDASGILHAFSDETNIFITPSYQFKLVDIILTNFHLPKSTLFMLVCAFAGLDKMKAAYAHAIAKEYRFYSYGDACLLEKQSDISC